MNLATTIVGPIFAIFACQTSLNIEDLGRLLLESIAILSLFESYGYFNSSNQTSPSTLNPGLIFDELQKNESYGPDDKIGNNFDDTHTHNSV